MLAPSVVSVIWKKTEANTEFPPQCDVIQSGQGLGASGNTRSTYILDFDIRWSSPVSLTRSSHFTTEVSTNPPPCTEGRRAPQVLLTSRKLNHGSSALYTSHFQNYVPLEPRHDCWCAERQESAWAYSYKTSPEKLNERYGHLNSENRLLCSSK
jgi:hypothetical protein